jgi:hypothetical protein
LITQRKLAENQKENIHLLTESSLELVPVIFEIVNWADKNVRKFNVQIPAPELLGWNTDKSVLIQNVQAEYKKMTSEILD